MNLRLEGRAALVAGGGAVAHRKVAGLLAAGAAVTVVAPKLSPPLAALAADGSITWLAQLATAEVFASLPRALLVFCATDDRAANAAFGKAAKEAGALVNDATTPELCDFFLPAALRDGDLLVTVSTGGASPALARTLKKRLAAQARENNRSMEAEARAILTSAVRKPHIGLALMRAVRESGGIEDLPVPTRTDTARTMDLG